MPSWIFSHWWTRKTFQYWRLNTGGAGSGVARSLPSGVDRPLRCAQGLGHRYREFSWGPAHAGSQSGDAVVLPWSDHDSRRQVGTSLETSILAEFCSPLARLGSLFPNLGLLAFRQHDKGRVNPTIRFPSKARGIQKAKLSLYILRMFFITSHKPYHVPERN